MLFLWEIRCQSGLKSERERESQMTYNIIYVQSFKDDLFTYTIKTPIKLYL